MYLSTDGGYHYYNAQHALKREATTLNGRCDIKNHLTQLLSDGKISNRNFQRLFEIARKQYPDWNEQNTIPQNINRYFTFARGSEFLPSCVDQGDCNAGNEQNREYFEVGATHITIDDCMRLQQSIESEGIETAIREIFRSEHCNGSFRLGVGTLQLPQ